MLILIIIAVIAIIAAIAIPNYLRYQQQKKIAVTKAKGKAIQQALATYRADHKTYPRGGRKQLYKALTTATKAGGPYMRTRPNPQGVFVDGFGKPYFYLCLNNKKYTFYSAGPNKKYEGGKGDDIQ